MAKRKAADADSPEPTATRRSTRQSTRAQPIAQETVESDVATKKARRKTSGKTKIEPAPEESSQQAKVKKEETIRMLMKSETDGETPTEQQFWLMKAEPESRFENGHDVRFSIDDLAAKTEPEPWDGIRNYVARNNLRAMKKGDLSFFYHSNCKEPGIVGIMEVVSEHEPDVTAYQKGAAYYDPKDNPENPKWSIVKVEFRRKFTVSIGLKELKELGTAGKPLANMQMLRQSRLSVSKVSPAEWKFLMDLVEEREKEAKV